VSAAGMSAGTRSEQVPFAACKFVCHAGSRAISARTGTDRHESVEALRISLIPGIEIDGRYQTLARLVRTQARTGGRMRGTGL
jgi:hypothetical protein